MQGPPPMTMGSSSERSEAFRGILESEEQGLSFEEIIEKVEAYIDSQMTWFVLENLETLRKNGRLSKVKAFVATALRIKPVMVSTPEGEIALRRIRVTLRTLNCTTLR